MVRRSLLFAVLAPLVLSGCKSVWGGTFNLLNSPAMEVARLTPQIAVTDRDRADFARDKIYAGMAISGGGMRASAFTLGVIAGLQEIKDSNNRSALDYIDFASANSGGSWALAAHLANRRGGAPFTATSDYSHYAKKFKALNKSRTKHWAEAMQATLDYNLTMGDIRDTHPRAFFNATLLPSHDPFVFTQEFADKYSISAFYARGDKKQPFGKGRAIDSLPLGYVAATSGSVPGFTHSFASTSLCANGQLMPSFCGTDRNGGWLRMVDGGLYDNTAYKTAWEVALSTVTSAAPARRVMLLVDSKNGWPMPTASASDARGHDGLISAGGKLLTKSSFPLQESTFRRLAGKMFESAGYRTLLLDFDAASGYHEGESVQIDDLKALLAMAADKIPCITDEGKVLKASSRKRPTGGDERAWLRERGGDCLENNFARVGYRHKTTYFYDPDFFAATYQLGVFVARRRATKIKEELGMN